MTEAINSYDDIYKTICRVCLSHSKCDDMVSLFDKNDEDGLSCYGKSVITFANVLLKSDDNFPPMMCKNCVSLLKQAIRFKFKCENSDVRLKKLMKIKQSTNQNYHEILCQYTFFNYYFPVKSFEKRSRSIDESIPPVKPTVSDQKTTENTKINLQNTTAHDNVTSNDKIDKTFGQYYKENNMLDYHDDPCDDDVEKKTLGLKKRLDVKILDRLENLFNSDIDIKRSPYINKSGHKKCKKVKLKATVEKPKKFTCKTCNKVLNNRLTYSRHMQRHNGYRFMCETCGKPFTTQTELNMHQVVTHGIGPYLECDYCSYKAPRKLNLIEHIRLHTGERPYTCDKCGLTFRRKAIWKKHLIHHAEKSIQCPQCPKKFFRQSAMSSHMNNIHDRMYVFMCNKCGATYSKTVTVRRHLSEKHGVPRELQGKIIRVMRNDGSDVTLKHT